jgi:hypothetical protein
VRPACATLHHLHHFAPEILKICRNYLKLYKSGLKRSSEAQGFRIQVCRADIIGYAGESFKKAFRNIGGFLRNF